MTKINYEEYKVLKALDDQWEWIARDNPGGLFVYKERPERSEETQTWGDLRDNCAYLHNGLFQFIQWEDGGPWNIQELIEGYEEEEYGYFNMKLSREFEQFSEESEETEMKKDLIEAILSIEVTQFDGYKADLEEFVNPKQLEEIINDWVPEVLSQELPVIPQWVADNIESKKRVGTRLNVAMSEFPEFKLEKELDINEHECNEIYARAWLDGFTVKKEQKYYLKIGNLYLAEPLGDMTSDIIRMTRDKGVAYQFTDEKSIAVHLDKFEGTEAVKVEEEE